MNLSEEQRQKIASWIADGAKLSEIQSRLSSEFGLKLTYMEARFLVDDLRLTPKDPEASKSPPPEIKSSAVAPAPAINAAEEDEPEPPSTGSNKVSVGVDQIARAGAIVSGKVTFSDGQTAEWYLDQTGRLGVIPKKQGYKPSPADVQDFQMALQQEIARLGY